MTAVEKIQIESFGKLLHEKFDTQCMHFTDADEHLNKELEGFYKTVRVITGESMELETDQKHVPNCWKLLDSPEAILSRPRECD